MGDRDGTDGRKRAPLLCNLGGLATALVLLGASCLAAPRASDERTELQRASLRNVFVSDGAPPPAPDDAEREAARLRGESFPEELEELRGFVSDPDLRVLALRDSDGDGVHDYRISDFHGKFVEGDVDVDGDGIRNALDAAPYDPGSGGADDDGDGAPDRDFADHDSDGVPDHVDWSASDPVAAGWQAELFREHGVLLVARGAPFTRELARSVRDALTRVFRRPLEEGGLASLRVIATDELCLLYPEEGGETNAMVVPQTQTLFVYRVGIDYAPIAQLALLVHELGHVWQYDQDFDADDLAAENGRVYYAQPNFFAMLDPQGWSTEQREYDPETDDYRLFTPHYFTLGPDHQFREESVEAWSEYLTAIYEEVGEDYLEDERLEGILGDYSLTSPLEWHADSLQAYVLESLEARAEETLEADEAEALVGALRGFAQEAWPSFRYQNYDHELLDPHFGLHFPLADADLNHLIEAYLRPAAAQVSED